MTMVGNELLTIKDFTGGQTDQVIGRNPILSSKLRNFQIDVDGSIRVRPGSSSDGGTDTANKLTSGVDLLVKALVDGEKPYKLSTGSNKGKLFYFAAGTHTELTGPSGNSLFTTAHGAAADHRFVTSRWNDQLFIASTSFTQKLRRVFIDNAGAIQMRTVGLPKFDGTTTYTTAGTAGTYVYAFVWKHTYTSGNRTFIDRSAPYFETKANIYSNVKGTAGTLVNSGGESYFAVAASANESLVLEVYRTVTAGNTLYLVGSIDYGSLSTGVTDGVADATLINNATLYSTGGLPERADPPVCKFFHITEDGIGLYGYIQDGNDVMKNRVGQSMPGIPGARPSTFFADSNDEVTGVSSYRGVPIVFGPTSLYRGEGTFAATGDGVFKLKKIIDGVGCINQNSIVQTFAGVFFAAASGFYWTDGYNVKKISDELNSTYAAAYSTTARKQACVGTFDEVNLRVYWTGIDTSTSDLIFVFHLRYGIKEQGVFAIWSGYTTTLHAELHIWPPTTPTTITQNFQAKCLLWVAGTLYRGDNRGYTFAFDEAVKTDPRVNTSVATHSDWGGTYIYYDWESVALDFGDSLVRKWTPSAEVVLTNRGDISVSLVIDRDLQGQYRKCKEIKEKSSVAWMDDGVLWGDEALWNSDHALYIYQRRFPAPGFRCTYRTVGLTNAFTVIQKSDNLGTGVLTKGLTSGTLQLGGSNTWPVDVKDYYLALESDGYLDKFLVTGRTSTTITVSDPNGRLPASGTYAWQLHGYAKGQIVDIQAVNIPYQMLTDSQVEYRAGTEGENA